MGVDGKLQPLYPPRKETNYQSYRSWVGQSGQVQKISTPPPRGFDPWTVQHIVSRYTDYDIPVHAGIT